MPWWRACVRVFSPKKVGRTILYELFLHLKIENSGVVTIAMCHQIVFEDEFPVEMAHGQDSAATRLRRNDGSGAAASRASGEAREATFDADRRRMDGGEGVVDTVKPSNVFNR